MAAARREFADRGFERATIRGIAGRAGVDPALVHHYFGSKRELFRAAMQLPVDVAGMVDRIVDGPHDQLGERFVRAALEQWEQPASRELFLGIIRSATTDPVAAEMLREILTEGPLLALASISDRPDARFRGTLAGSQIVGLAIARYVVRVEPLASAPPNVVAAAVGPTLQRYFAADLR